MVNSLHAFNWDELDILDVVECSIFSVRGLQEYDGGIVSKVNPLALAESDCKRKTQDSHFTQWHQKLMN